MEVAFTWSVVEVNDKIMNPQNIWKRIEALYLSVPLSLYPCLEFIFFFLIIFLFMLRKGFRGVSVVKNLPTDARDARHMGSIPGSGRSPGEGNGNPLQYSCLENFMDKGAWRATVHGVAKSQKWLNTDTHPNTHAHKSTNKVWAISKGKSSLKIWCG